MNGHDVALRDGYARDPTTCGELLLCVHHAGLHLISLSPAHRRWGTWREVDAQVCSRFHGCGAGRSDDVSECSTSNWTEGLQHVEVVTGGRTSRRRGSSEAGGTRMAEEIGLIRDENIAVRVGVTQVMARKRRE